MIQYLRLSRRIKMVDLVIDIMAEITDFFLNLWTDKLEIEKRKRRKP